MGPWQCKHHSRGPATPGALTKRLWAAKAIFGMPFPSHGVCCSVLSALCAAVNVGHPAPHAALPGVLQAGVSQAPGAGTMLSAHKSHSHEIHKGTEEPHASTSTKITICDQTTELPSPCLLPPPAHIHTAHRNYPQALPGCFPGTLCTAKHLKHVQCFLRCDAWPFGQQGLMTQREAMSSNSKHVQDKIML